MTVYPKLFASCAIWIVSLTPALASAAPAPIFQSIVPELKSKLPSGWNLRLPSYLPDAPVQLYPYVRSSAAITQVNIAISPDCATSRQPASCTIGGIGVLSPTKKNWLPAKQKLTAVSLSQGIKGYYTSRNDGKFIFWEQEGQRYTIGAIARGISLADLVEIANSAINEAPINSTRQ